MIMNRLQIIFTVVTLIVSMNAYSGKGGIDSGGGGAYLCTDEVGGQKTFLLDLWEAENLPNRKWKVPKSNEDVDSQIDKALGKLAVYDSDLPRQIKSIINHLFSQSVEVNRATVELEPPRDAHSNYKMKGCDLKGMMFFDRDLQKLAIDQTLFKILAKTIRYRKYIF